MRPRAPNLLEILAELDPLICDRASRIRGTGITSQDDLRQAAREAVIRLFRRKPPTPGAPLDHWAGQRIRGAMVDEIRSVRYGRKQGERDVEPVSLDAARCDADVTLANLVAAPEPDSTDAVRGAWISEELGRRDYSEAEATAVRLSAAGWRLADIGRFLGVSESRVCQIRSRVLARLVVRARTSWAA
jgi:RNA polymerase sigma factor (sigma-70 family)